MLIKTKNVPDDICQLLESDLRNEGSSILQQQISDNKGFVFCYLYKNFWIEVSPCHKVYHADITNQKLRWEAFIHCCTGTLKSKTAFALGSYPTRLEAALKAEQIIKQWHLQLQ